VLPTEKQLAADNDSWLNGFGQLGLHSTMSYTIVAFEEMKETNFMLIKWIADDITDQEMIHLVRTRSTLNWCWPSWKNPAAISRAKKKCQDSEVVWPVCRGRILLTASKR
jgi:hypothetical protein